MAAIPTQVPTQEYIHFVDRGKGDVSRVAVGFGGKPIWLAGKRAFWRRSLSAILGRKAQEW
jgi:hypothetical protein